MENLLTADKLADGLLWYVVFLFSTTVHEAAHAWSAMRMGDYTAYHGGQVTLNPVPHIQREPFGLVIIPILTFFLGGWMMGWASAPYDPQWALRYPKRSALMSLAGPAANLVLVLLSAALIRLGIANEIFVAPEHLTFSHIVESVSDGTLTHGATMLSVFFSLNLLLFAFNLMPLPPLDGSGIIPLFMSDSLGQKYMSALYRSGAAFFGLFLAWQLFGKVFGPIHSLAISLLYPGMHYQ